jgi:adenosine deaminase
MKIDAADIPKAELHLHIEGTLEPEMLFEFARRNGIATRFDDVETLRAAYRFEDLQSFLDLYYQGAAVLRTAEDFHDLTWAYLERVARAGVVRAEIFFDPQTHTERGISLDTVFEGITSALDRAEPELGIGTGLIMCFVRHLSERAALDTLDAAGPHLDRLLGVGLDSSEIGHPPDDFARVFARARDAGLHVVVHAGEEGPPEYVWQALDTLGAERIDHGVRSIEDPALVERLVRDAIPLTVCPLSNVALGGVPSLEDHPLRKMRDAGLRVTINSDDPAYFGGYVDDNYRETAAALSLTDQDLVDIARVSLESSFVDDEGRQAMLRLLRDAVGR